MKYLPMGEAKKRYSVLGFPGVAGGKPRAANSAASVPVKQARRVKSEG